MRCHLLANRRQPLEILCGGRVQINKRRFWFDLRNVYCGTLYAEFSNSSGARFSNPQSPRLYTRRLGDKPTPSFTLINMENTSRQGDEQIVDVCLAQEEGARKFHFARLRSLSVSLLSLSSQRKLPVRESFR